MPRGPHPSVLAGFDLGVLSLGHVVYLIDLRLKISPSFPQLLRFQAQNFSRIPQTCWYLLTSTSAAHQIKIWR